MEIAARSGRWRLFATPLVALALLFGYVVYTHGGSSGGLRHAGAPAVTKLTAGDLLLAAAEATKGIYLEWDGVTGAPSSTHTDHAVINSFSWGVNAPTSVASGGVGVGKAKVADVTITKLTDKYSQGLISNELHGGHANHAILYFTDVNSKGAAFDYLEFDFANVYVTNYSVKSSGDKPAESVSFTFTAFTIKAHSPGLPTQSLTYSLLTSPLG